VDESLLRYRLFSAINKLNNEQNDLKPFIMKKLLVLSFAFLFVAVSCKKVTDEPTSDFDTMTTYMVENGMDLPDVLNAWIVGPPALEDVQSFISTYDIIDIRGPQDYAAGHIEGAVNSTLANILTTAENTTKTILVVCYTGQSAGHGVVALRLSGYDAKVLKWGMSGWRLDMAGPWLANSGPDNGITGIGHTNWVTTGTLPAENFDDPTINIGGNGANILEARVEYMLLNGFSGVVNTSVLDMPTDYFINNFWDETDVDHYGHISGAYRIKPLSIAGGEINNLDPDETVVTYCWTGQTSSMITAYLTVLGYDAKSLKFGANGMIYTDLTSHKYVAPTVDLPVVQ
jgi:rhodanese-related sulfurtransferase